MYPAGPNPMSETNNENDRTLESLAARLADIESRLTGLADCIRELSSASAVSDVIARPQTDNQFREQIVVLEAVPPEERPGSNRAPQNTLPLREISELHPRLKLMKEEERLKWLMGQCKKKATGLAPQLLADCLNEIPLCDMFGPKRAWELVQEASEILIASDERWKNENKKEATK